MYICLKFLPVDDKKKLQKCVGTLLAQTCELETDLGWYYQAFTKCALKVIAGSMYREK